MNSLKEIKKNVHTKIKYRVKLVVHSNLYHMKITGKGNLVKLRMFIFQIIFTSEIPLNVVY